MTVDRRIAIQKLQKWAVGYKKSGRSVSDICEAIDNSNDSTDFKKALSTMIENRIPPVMAAKQSVVIKMKESHSGKASISPTLFLAAQSYFRSWNQPIDLGVATLLVSSLRVSFDKGVKTVSKSHAKVMQEFEHPVDGSVTRQFADDSPAALIQKLELLQQWMTEDNITIDEPFASQIIRLCYMVSSLGSQIKTALNASSVEIHEFSNIKNRAVWCLKVSSTVLLGILDDTKRLQIPVNDHLLNHAVDILCNGSEIVKADKLLQQMKADNRMINYSGIRRLLSQAVSLNSKRFPEYLFRWGCDAQIKNIAMLQRIVSWYNVGSGHPCGVCGHAENHQRSWSKLTPDDKSCVLVGPLSIEVLTSGVNPNEIPHPKEANAILNLISGIDESKIPTSRPSKVFLREIVRMVCLSTSDQFDGVCEKIIKMGRIRREELIDFVIINYIHTERYKMIRKAIEDIVAERTWISPRDAHQKPTRRTFSIISLGLSVVEDQKEQEFLHRKLIDTYGSEYKKAFSSLDSKYKLLHDNKKKKKKK